MLRTVLWQREHAVPGYIEVPCDEAAWKEYGLQLQKRERMLVNAGVKAAVPFVRTILVRMIRTGPDACHLN